MAFASETWTSSFSAVGTLVQREKPCHDLLSRHGGFSLCSFRLRNNCKSSVSSAEHMLLRRTWPIPSYETLGKRLNLTMAAGRVSQKKLQHHRIHHLQYSLSSQNAFLSGLSVLRLRPVCIPLQRSLVAFHESLSYKVKAFDVQSCDVNGGDGEVSHKAEMRRLWQQIKLVVLVLPALLVGVLPALATAKATTGASVAAVGRAVTSQRGAQVFASAWTGFIAGCLHTLTGPDHLAALAPLSIGRSKLQGAMVGALWGCGHDAGQVLFGLLFILLKDKLHIDLIRTWGARVVGLTLLAIGAMGMREAQEASLPCLAGDGSHVVITESAEGYTGQKKPFRLATFLTGVVHGLQPDALLVILPALALPSRLAGTAFLSTFLLGTVMAMGSYTAFIGSCSEALQERVPWITHRLAWGSSLIALAVGISILLGELLGVNLF
ncbi:hypothetical protein O6H91_08G111800 [Diphasiastrum complanatum]|uniref:Uncharacterized protein n=3 Tax=Diphasiastrum complanatum TaxID=34168 RepID=A0ACC2D1F3_DIPCM|nr:hypothetical protein O6H91_08G111800 [Diphasiastrum complanatum]KAJ7547972.1 hypothetical protein O6H91_08G111800 [Diphasiastrum complanatum]KAJ7547973.1 hypothetical protein O6H91_08G111800 [Diphasiastrum complanatum]